MIDPARICYLRCRFIILNMDFCTDYILPGHLSPLHYIQYMYVDKEREIIFLRLIIYIEDILLYLELASRL